VRGVLYPNALVTQYLSGRGRPVKIPYSPRERGRSEGCQGNPDYKLLWEFAGRQNCPRTERELTAG